MNKISSGSESAKFEQEPVSPDFLQEQIRLPRNQWSEVLSEISENQGVEYRIEPRNIKVIERMNDIILKSVLVMWRKKDSVVKNSP